MKLGRLKFLQTQRADAEVRDYLVSLLEKHGRCFNLAAEEAGIVRANFHREMKRVGLNYLQFRKNRIHRCERCTGKEN